MTRVVFVHGTGVRARSFEKSFTRITRRLNRVRPDVETVPCFWGEEHGARLALGGASLPRPDRGRAVPGHEADGTLDGFAGGGNGLQEPLTVLAALDSDPLAVWAALDADPFAELRARGAIAQQQGHRGGGFVPGRTDPVAALAQRLRTLALDGLAAGDEETSLLAEELGPHLAPAADGTARTLPELLRGVPDVDGALRLAAARAVIASAFQLAEEAEEAEETEEAAEDGSVPVAEPLPADGADRDALVEEIALRLGGADRGPVGGLLRGADPALRGLSGLARWQRARISTWIMPSTGDIIRYQARGEELRTHIAQTVQHAAKAAGGPVTVLAHSLGGIACVDLLAGRDLPEVGLLVTVGSQAPLLYEMDALSSLRRGQELPGHFPRWVNVYDPHDLLGYVGEQVFPGRVTDVRVQTRQPFPRAHSAYFGHRALYRLLAAELPC